MISVGFGPGARTVRVLEVSPRAAATCGAVGVSRIADQGGPIVDGLLRYNTEPAEMPTHDQSSRLALEGLMKARSLARWLARLGAVALLVPGSASAVDPVLHAAGFQVK